MSSKSKGLCIGTPLHRRGRGRPCSEVSGNLVFYRRVKPLAMEYFSFLPRYLHKQFRSTLQPLTKKTAFFEYLRGTFYSLPVQLLFLHFRKYQVLLLFWVVLFTTVGGAFMKTFGAEALFLAPEYMGDVNALGAALVGVAIGIFIMCWNVTTFILFSRHFTFLAATQYPFLKYCINNSAIPLSFLVFYLIKASAYLHTK